MEIQKSQNLEGGRVGNELRAQEKREKKEGEHKERYFFLT